MGKTETRLSWLELLTSYPARLGAYGLITMTVFQLVYTSLQDHGAEWLAAENGPIELTQVACLLMAVAGISVAVRWSPIGRAGAGRNRCRDALRGGARVG